MIVEKFEHFDALTCDRCRNYGPGWVAHLYESDRGQYVYSIRLNLTLSLCYDCTPKEPDRP